MELVHLIDSHNFQAKTKPLSHSSMNKLDSLHLKKENERFYTFLNVIKEILPDDTDLRIEMVSTYLPTLEIEYAPLLAMEYYYTVGEYNLLQQIINSEEKSDNELNREWAKVYQIMLNKNNGVITNQEYGNLIMQTKVQSTEMHLLLCLLNMHSVYEMGEYEAFFKVSQAILPTISEIEDSYIRHSFELRLLQLYSFSHLLSNNVEKCREIIEEIIVRANPTIYANILTNAYHVYGQSYIFSSFDKSLERLNMAIETANYLPSYKRDEKISEITKTIDFIRSYWKKDLHLLPKDSAELAYRYIALNEMEKAEEILNKLYCEQGGNLTAFQWYYYGLVTGNSDYFRKAKQSFWFKRDKFFVKILEIL